MKKKMCCAILGHSPMRFEWGFDEEDVKCQKLKLELLQLIMELRQQDVVSFTMVCDCGVGLYAGEIINLLRENDEEIQLYCVTPHEEQATKWAPYLRDRYFEVLEKCTYMEAISHHKTPACHQEAYTRIVDYADVLIAVYDPESSRNDVIDGAVCHAIQQQKRIIYIHPDTFMRS